MSATKSIASVIGPTLAAIGIALIARPEQFLGMTDELRESAALIFMSGAILLAVGLAIVRAHNVWRGPGPLLVTVFGWLAILSGLSRIFAPRETSASALSVFSSPPAVMAGGAVMLVAGAVYCFIAFRAR